jgi:hypothetical protein
MRKQKCAQCGIDYPEKLLSVFQTNKGLANVCGICALEMKNAIHGTNDKQFMGTEAEKKRKQAIAYRGKRVSGKRE